MHNGGGLEDTRCEIREEVQRDKVRLRAGKKAWRFEENLREGRGGGRVSKKVHGGDEGKRRKGERMIRVGEGKKGTGIGWD